MQIPASLLDKASLLSEPVTIQYLSMSLPPYMFVALIALSAVGWSYYSTPLAYDNSDASAF